MSIPKIPADGFVVFHGTFGFSLAVQQLDLAPGAPAIVQHGQSQVMASTAQEIRMSPLTAKSLLHALRTNLAQYEDQFGEIKGPPPPVPN